MAVAAAGVRTGGGVGHVRVLCVDDNADIAESEADILTLTGFQARAAFGGAEGLALARSFRPHACVLDINMPGMDGYELATKLRALLGPVLLVAVTAAVGDDHDRRMEAAGFDLAFAKPAHPWQLVEAITAHAAQ